MALKEVRTKLILNEANCGALKISPIFDGSHIANSISFVLGEYLVITVKKVVKKEVSIFSGNRLYGFELRGRQIG